VKPAVFHPKARAELDKEVEYYQARRPGLGLDFAAEIRRAVRRIRRFPGIGAPYKQTNYRKLVVPRFPFNVFYLVQPDHVWIAAVAHQKRRPDYWAGRVP
jgi:plasmid stabilization system protein ParE